ncbi:MAG: hypothetical protein P4L49_19010 [Desulfosporosinus sp.]|nr:hypothetical protein [Desulfosporosinus sp.]
MDDQVEEIRPIRRVSPVRKVALVRPRRGRRELMFQFNQKGQIPNKIKLDKEKIPVDSQSTDSSTVPNPNEYALELKKRIAFDRAMIIGEELTR